MADLDELVRRGVISDDVAARLMTHQPEEPNPLRPYLDKARQYLQSGDFNPAHEPGTQPRDYLRELLRNPDILAKNVEQASRFNFGGMANPKPVIIGKVAAQVDDLVARGFGQKAIAAETGKSRASIRRYLNKTDQVTAGAENAAENPSWTPETEAAFKADIGRGASISEAAKNADITRAAADAKIRRLIKAGRWEGYPSRDPYFFENPERMDRLEQLGRENWSLREMVRDPQLGAVGSGQVSQWIKGMQERHGRMLDWRPQGGVGLTPGGRTATLVQTKTQARPITPEDLEAGRDFTKAMRAFLPQSP